MANESLQKLDEPSLYERARKVSPPETATYLQVCWSDMRGVSYGGLCFPDTEDGRRDLEAEKRKRASYGVTYIGHTVKELETLESSERFTQALKRLQDEEIWSAAVAPPNEVRE